MIALRSLANRKAGVFGLARSGLAAVRALKAGGAEVFAWDDKDELRQSARIVKQALDGMPAGPWKADAPHVVLPDREKMKTQMEALIYHFKIVTEGFQVPAGDVYQVVESPRGELGYYVVSDGGPRPYRVFVHGPSFGNLQGLPKMVEGRLVADAIAALGSTDFVLGDVDR